ncbi:MAG TPA: LpxD N-terminal domain-containing protein, partial [Chloroflexota bacterium]|nr:LpxD N-terminal domain-containing protein [Chloroflexota bacterium]
MTERIPLGKVLDILGDAVIRVSGPPTAVVTHAAPIHEADDERAITFCRRSGPEALALIRSTRAGVVLCADDPLLRELADCGKTVVTVQNPRLSFLRLVRALFAEPQPRGIHPTAVIHPEATVHPDVYIGPFTYL